MNHASLFSGIGGFDLAASWMGWNNIFQVEKDEWCQSILVKHFPETERYLDIKEFSGEKYRGTIDVISGGFPCQPFSVAGKQKGKEDDRYLWPEMLRVIREIQPTWVVGENVPGILSMALDTVLTDLEGEGYATQPFVIPACGINAVHKRDRIWILAYSDTFGRERRQNEHGESGKREIRENLEYVRDQVWSETNGLSSVATNAEHDGFFASTDGGSTRSHARQSEEGKDELFESSRKGFVSNAKGEQSQPDDVRKNSEPKQIKFGRRNLKRSRLSWPISQPTICRGNDGISYRLDDGRLITAKQRTNALKGLGNAVVPQVVYEIFKIIKLMTQK